MTKERVWFGQFEAMAFNKVGLRHKFPGRPWQAPYENHQVPLLDDDLSDTSDLYSKGVLVPRERLPEASAVYDAKCFAKQKDISRAGFCYIVDERLFDLLSEFDVGPGGLSPYSIFESDEVTPIKDRWWLLGLGAQKRSFRGDLSQNAELLVDGKGEKDSLYMAPFPPGNDAFVYSSAALDGADIWRETELMLAFSFSDRLGAALMDAGYGKLFGLQTARVVDEGLRT